MSISVFCRVGLGQELKGNTAVSAKDNVAGEKLLRKGLLSYSKGKGAHYDIIRTAGEKPRVDLVPPVDFNLSYSEEVIVCAVSADWVVGVDVEAYRELDLISLKPRYAPAEWYEIENSRFPHRTAIDYWVRKEAVLKAHGVGLFVAPEMVDATETNVALEGEYYTLRKVEVPAGYCCWLAYRRLAAAWSAGSEYPEIDIAFLD